MNLPDFSYGILFGVVIEILLVKILPLLCIYTTVRESTCKVYTLFGKVELVLKEPGFHFTLPALGWKAFLINWFGQTYIIDMRMDQVYLRSHPVNSEEGAPMGIGIWYEMFISDPIAYLFRNTDPKGSLGANVSNAAVRCLSNLPLAKLLEERHSMSQTVRQEVSQKSNEWGYRLGSVYIRKVHFRDHQMIQQIESKVVNRLRQVTAKIRQEGENQVNVITSTAQRKAAVEFARAAAIRPKIVGDVLQKIAQDADVYEALFSTLEAQRMMDSGGELVLVPNDESALILNH